MHIHRLEPEDDREKTTIMGDNLANLRLSDTDKEHKKERRLRWLPIGLAAIITVAWVSVWLFQRINKSQLSAPPNTPSSQVAVKQQAGAAENTEHSIAENVVMAGGFIEARRSAKVYPGRDGIVSDVHVEEGQFVHKGELLVTLDTGLVAAEVAIAEAELQKAQAALALVTAGYRKEDILDMRNQVAAAEAKWNREKDLLQRTQPLLAASAVSEREVAEVRFKAAECEANVQVLKARLAKLESGFRVEDIAAARAESARALAALRYAEEKLALSYLKAPFDGVVTEVELEPGEALSTMSGSDGGLGIKMADTTSLYVKLDIPENKIATIKRGSAAEVFAEALGKDPLTGQVSGIAPVADRQSNTVEITVKINAPPPLLRPDMSARVRIKTVN